MLCHVDTNLQYIAVPLVIALDMRVRRIGSTIILIPLIHTPLSNYRSQHSCVPQEKLKLLQQVPPRFNILYISTKIIISSFEGQMKGNAEYTILND